MRSMAIVLPVVVSTLLVAAAQPGNTASEQSKTLQQAAQVAATSGNHQARIAADLALLRLLHGSPLVVEALARAYAAAADEPHAVAELNRFADLGQADERLLAAGDERLASLKRLPAYQRVLARMAVNQAPVSRAQVAFVLPGADILPEDIDYDAASNTFLVTSILERRILRVRPDGTGEEFAASPDGWPMAAIKIDAAHHQVWATEVAFDGLALAPAAAWGRSAVLCFDLQTGKLTERIEGPRRASLGDMALSPEGEPIVSDGEGGVLYRVAQGRIEPINRGDFISPQTGAWIPSAHRLLVPDYVRGIGRVDLGTGRVSWLNPDGRDRAALHGIDGLYGYGKYLIATQNGSSPQRIALFTLDATQTHIQSTTVIQQSASPGCDPTHGVVVGNSFYYIANSGWATLDDAGNTRPGMQRTKAVIMRYRLP